MADVIEAALLTRYPEPVQNATKAPEMYSTVEVNSRVASAQPHDLGT
jgi:hypothetical protein